MNEINSLKEIAQEIVDSYEGKNIDELGIVELSRLKRDYRALHKLNLDLKNRSRFDENVDTADYDDISLESENLWTLVQKELPLIEDVLSRKAQLAMGKTTRRRDVMANKARNLSSLKKIADVLADLQASEKNAGSTELKAVYASPINALKSAVQEMMDYDRKCDDEIKQLGEEIEILRMGGNIPEYDRIKTHDEELLHQVETEKREIVEKSNETKRFILDDSFKNGYNQDDSFKNGYNEEDLRVEGDIKVPEAPSKNEVFPVSEEIDYTKDDAFRYGYISNKGKFVADDAFKNGFITGDSLYIADDAFKYGYVDNKGKFVADDAFKNGYLKEGKYIADDAFKFGYITKTGKWVNDDAFKNGYINADNRYVADDAFKFGFINLDSRFVADDAFKNGYINEHGDFVEDKDLKFGYMSKSSGEYVADNAFANGYINADNQYTADDAFKFGYLNTKGEFVADNSFKNGYSEEEKRENTGFILVGDTFKDEYPKDKGLNVEEKSGDEEKEPTALVPTGVSAMIPAAGIAAAAAAGVSAPIEPEEESTKEEEESTKTVVVPPVMDSPKEEAVDEFPAEEEKVEGFPVEEEKVDAFPEEEKIEGFPEDEKVEDFPEDVEAFPEEEEDDDKPLVAPLPRTKVITKKPAKTKLLARFTAYALAAVAVLAAFMAGKNTVFSRNVAAKAVVDDKDDTKDKDSEYGKGDEVVKPSPKPSPNPKPTNPNPQPYYPPSDPGPYYPDYPVVIEQPDYPDYPEDPVDPYVEDPVIDEPIEDEPIEDEPIEDEPIEDEPIEDEPIEDEPIEDEPIEDDPYIPEDPTPVVPEEPTEPELPEDSILIDEGEAVIDLDTGVEEVHDGTLYDHSDGETDIPSGQDPTPTYTEDGASVITPDDLQPLPEPPAPPEEEPGTLADAQEQLSADEFDNLISAFNDEFVSNSSPEAPVESYEAPAESYEAPAEVPSYEAPVEAPAPVEAQTFEAAAPAYEAPVEAPAPVYEAPVEVPTYEAPAEVPSYEAPAESYDAPAEVYDYVAEESGPTLTLSN